MALARQGYLHCKSCASQQLELVGLIYHRRERKLLIRLECGACGQASWLDVAQGASGIEVSCYLASRHDG